MQKKNDMYHINHFIWDFDGTLFDSYPIIIGTLRSTLQDCGYDCDPSEAMQLMLQNITVAQKHYAEKFGIPMEELLKVYAGHHEAQNPQLLAKPMADVEKVLARICETGRKNYIFTHRKCSTTAQYLDKYGLSHYFTEIVGPEAAHFAYKPAPDALLYLMDKYGMTTEDAVMVGDRDCDLGSARNAGISTAHYVCAMVPETLSCDFRFENYQKMLAIL
ncbi:MAG: phosphoglycolate phosphatase [Ruminococcaceae bacterium]|nr:phosphoglycolate phosphatase [Oscillospiraceae bacterium]